MTQSKKDLKPLSPQATKALEVLATSYPSSLTAKQVLLRATGKAEGNSSRLLKAIQAHGWVTNEGGSWTATKGGVRQAGYEPEGELPGREKKEKSKRASQGSKRTAYVAFEIYPATAFIRWLGSQGLTTSKVNVILEGLLAEGLLNEMPKKSTIATQTGWGKRGGLSGLKGIPAPAKVSQEHAKRSLAFLPEAA